MKQSTDAKGLVVPILVIFFLITLPIVFHIIAHFERHKTRSGQEKITLFRSAVVWILALIIYLVAAYAAIQCTQSKDLQSTDLTVTVITKNNRTITYCRKVSYANNSQSCVQNCSLANSAGRPSLVNSSTTFLCWNSSLKQYLLLCMRLDESEIFHAYVAGNC